MNTLDNNEEETQEWLDSLAAVIETEGVDRADFLLQQLEQKLSLSGNMGSQSITTPYLNTIPRSLEPVYPGSWEIEKRLKSLIRWNAMAMVVQANKGDGDLGGHISTYQSAATLYEVGYNHFFRGRTSEHSGDLVFFQGHASPGIYARAYLEGRISENQLHNFRQELAEGGGLSSYPHPHLMPDFWQFPTVSMGLGPMFAIYHAKFAKYLANRGLKDTGRAKVWAFLGDGEMDEPDSTGALGVASRENLDNLIFVINCNLQRLDGPVRGNGKIIQELEGIFKGHGWNVIKVIWGGSWDAIIEGDSTGKLRQRFEETLDGEYQKLSVSTGDLIRKHFFGTDPELLKLVEHLSDVDLMRLPRGGHDSRKVHAAYRKAVDTDNGKPTVILTKTVKGYGVAGGEARNSTHQKKKLSDEELLSFKKRFNIPVADDQVGKAPFFRPDFDSDELTYLRDRRKELGGEVPKRFIDAPSLSLPAQTLYEEFYRGSGERAVSTTIGFVRLLVKLMTNKGFGKQIVPIVPDEARSFGMDAMFRQFGIYAHKGQLYEPVDKQSLLYYHEAKDGQMLEEGINEGGAISTFVAAGTAYSSFGIQMIPFYIYYSMFGFQRIGDHVWAGADMHMRGFLIGATAGRTTLNGEGLQHQDGHSHMLANTVPNCQSYDPAFMYEVAIVVKDGMKRMYEDQENVFYYLTVYNENHMQAPILEDVQRVEEGVVKGLYHYSHLQAKKSKSTATKINLMASGIAFQQALKAQAILAESYGVSVDLWSMPSVKRLRDDAMACDRWNRLHPMDKPRCSHIEETLEGADAPFLAVTDFMRSYSDLIGPWIPTRFVALGTDGFGRSDTRQRLRRFFEVDAESIVYTALHTLVANGDLDKKLLAKALVDLGIDSEKRSGLVES